MNKYILFVFASHPDQSKLVDLLAEDLCGITEKDIKYYYGSESIVFGLSSNGESNEINQYINDYFKELKFTYFFTKFDDRVSYHFEEGIEEYLFNTDKMSGCKDISSNKMEKEQKLSDDTPKFYNMLEDILFSDECGEQDDEDDDDDDVLTSILEKEYQPSLDEILDKISQKGMSSLSEKELSLLKQYSK